MPGVEFIELQELQRGSLRVARSPLFSLWMATRDAAGAERSGTPEAWCRAIRIHLTERDYEVLAPLSTSQRVMVPKAILPFPESPVQPLKDGLERIVAAESELVRDIHICMSHGRAGDWRPAERNPRQWTRGLVGALARAWNGFEPIWRQAQEALAREAERIATADGHTARLELLDTLLPNARVRGLRWEIEGFTDHDIGYRVADQGLVLVPLVAGPRASIVNHDAAAMQHVAYPLRAIHAVAPPSSGEPSSLEALLGVTRARLLRVLDEPLSNGGIADRLHVSPSTATNHVTTLKAAGLVSRQRAGRSVLVSRTARGDALLALYGLE